MKLELTEDEVKLIILSIQQTVQTMCNEHSKASLISSMGISDKIDELEKLKKLMVSFRDYEQDLIAEIKERYK